MSKVIFLIKNNFFTKFFLPKHIHVICLSSCSFSIQFKPAWPLFGGDKGHETSTEIPKFGLELIGSRS